jgi:hypothetical protein
VFLCPVAPLIEMLFCGLLTTRSFASKAANAAWSSFISAASISLTASSTEAIFGSFAAAATSEFAAFHSAIADAVNISTIGVIRVAFLNKRRYVITSSPKVPSQSWSTAFVPVLMTGTEHIGTECGQSGFSFR